MLVFCRDREKLTFVCRTKKNLCSFTRLCNNFKEMYYLQAYEMFINNFPQMYFPFLFLSSYSFFNCFFFFFFNNEIITSWWNRLIFEGFLTICLLFYFSLRTLFIFTHLWLGKIKIVLKFCRYSFLCWFEYKDFKKCITLILDVYKESSFTLSIFF